MFAARNSMMSGGISSLLGTSALWLADTGSDTSVWPDLSGNGRNAVQATTAYQPSIVSNALNGRQVRRFDGSNDYYSLSSGLDMFANVAGTTIILAYKWITNPTANKAVFFATTGGSMQLNRIALAGGLVSRKIYSGGRRLDSDAFARCDSDQDNPTNYYIGSSIFDFADSAVYQFINGSLDGANLSFQTNGTTSNTNSQVIRIGVTDISSNFDTAANVDIAELLVFKTALTPADRSRVERYLGAKWGIAVA